MVSALTRGRLHYAWIVAAVTFFTLLMSAGFRSTPGVIILPLEQEFGWTRATISLAVSVNILLYGLCGPFAAAFMDRFGVRRVMVLALLIVGTGAALTTGMRSSWQLMLLWGLVVGLGTGATAMVLGAMVANRWFVERRGLVMGVLSASSATGQLVFVPLLMSLAVAFGWRAVALTIAGLSALVVAPLVLLLMRGEPGDVGLRPYGAVGDATPALSTSGNPFLAALRGLALGLRSTDFWLLAGTFFICGATTNGLIGTHLIASSIEHGVPEVTAASFLAVIGLTDVIGVTISGWLSDRVDNRWLLCWYYAFRGLSLLFLPYAYGTGFLGLAAFAVVYGLDWVATLPPTARLAADIFGRRHLGIYFGWISASHQVGGAVAAFGAGVLRTWLGDYQVSFMAAGLLCLLASGMAIRIGRRSTGDLLPGRPRRVEASAAA